MRALWLKNQKIAMRDISQPRKKREVDPTVLIAKRFKLGEAVKAFEEGAQPGMLKVLLEP